jgi:hypothetical protein
MQTYASWNIGPEKALMRKVYSTQLWEKKYKDEECALHDAHFWK